MCLLKSWLFVQQTPEKYIEKMDFGQFTQEKKSAFFCKTESADFCSWGDRINAFENGSRCGFRFFIAEKKKRFAAASNDVRLNKSKRQKNSP